MDGTRELDLLTDFQVTDVHDVSVAGHHDSVVDDATTHTAGHAVSLSLAHGSGHVSHLTTDHQIVDQVMNVQEDEMMDVMTDDGLRSCSGSQEEPAGDQISVDDEDGEDEAMQFESAANKMFQSESQVVPLPTLRDMNHQSQNTFVNNISISGSISGSNSGTNSNNGIISSATSVPSVTSTNTVIGNSSNAFGAGAKIISIPAAAKSQVVTTSSGTCVGKTGNTILLPAGQSIPSAAELSNFITSIKPPAIPGVTGVQQQQISGTKQLILQKGAVLGTTQSVNKRPVGTSSALPNIVPHPGIQLVNASSSATASTNNLPPGSYKVIQLSSNGQQLAFVPAGTDASNTTGIRNTASVSTAASANVTASSTGKLEPAAGQKTAVTFTGSGGQQFVFLSPLKSGTGQPQTALRVANATQAGGSGLKTLAPAPSVAPVRVIQATSASSAATQLTKDGKNVQFIRVVTSSGAGAGLKGSTTSTLRTIAPSSGQKTVTLVPASVAGKSGTNLLSAGQLLTTTTGSGNQQVIMLPASVLQSGGIIRAATVPKVTLQNQSQQQQVGKSYVPIAPSPVGSHVSTIHPSSKDALSGLVKQQQQQQQQQQQHQPQQLQHLNGPSKSVSMNSNIQTGPASVPIEDLSRQRKPCNCTKSQCLKLYCDCFANGEFCKDCNCNNCNNNLEHEEERQKAVRQCLERNPQAFQPKIGKGRLTGDIPERRHTKGCNCRRSGCLKNYCECYEAKILCSELCKCSGCKNYEDSVERRSLQLMNLAEAAEYRSQQQSAASKLIWGSDYQAKLPVPSVTLNDRFPCSFISSEVIDATCQCLMATVEECEKTDMEYEAIEKALLLEFGRCLSQIIEFANKSKT